MTIDEWRATAIECRELARSFIEDGDAPSYERPGRLIRAGDLLKAAKAMDGYANMIELFEEE